MAVREHRQPLTIYLQAYQINIGAPLMTRRFVSSELRLTTACYRSISLWIRLLINVASKAARFYHIVCILLPHSNETLLHSLYNCITYIHESLLCQEPPRICGAGPMRAPLPLWIRLCNHTYIHTYYSISCCNLLQPGPTELSKARAGASRGHSPAVPPHVPSPPKATGGQPNQPTRPRDHQPPQPE